jgi:hypothetical protein
MTLNESTSEIEVVANAIVNVNAVGSDIASVNTLAGISNLQNLANAHTQITTVGNNIPAVEAFGNTYKISANAPSNPIEGTLWFDTTADTMKVYNGSSFKRREFCKWDFYESKIYCYSKSNNFFRCFSF